jgi:hypothetical protein
VQYELISCYETQLLEKQDSCCDVLIRGDNKDHISRTYRLFYRIPKGLEPVASIFQQHVTSQGISLIKCPEYVVTDKSNTRDMSGIETLIPHVTDTNLRHKLKFGIDLHHASLNDRDRTLVEEIFANNKIQVLVYINTLAWGVNFPAHLVIIKGTKYYDGKAKRYDDSPIIESLQMSMERQLGMNRRNDFTKMVWVLHHKRKNPHL